MRRFAPLGLLVLLCGCGFGTFLSDTIPFSAPPNPPIGDSENMRRVRAQASDVEPLQPEMGNVWPGPPPPEPTLSDIQRQSNPLPPPNLQPPGSSVPSAPGFSPSPVPGTVPNAERGSAPAITGGAIPPAARGSVLTTPRGPATNTGGTSHYQSYGAPSGSNAGGIMVPNGNGTSTLIAPDGSVSTVPTPK